MIPARQSPDQERAGARLRRRHRCYAADSGQFHCLPDCRRAAAGPQGLHQSNVRGLIKGLKLNRFAHGAELVGLGVHGRRVDITRSEL